MNTITGVKKIRFQGSMHGNEVNVPEEWFVQVRELEYSWSPEQETLWMAKTKAFTGIRIDDLAKTIIVGYAGEIEINYCKGHGEVHG